MEQQTQQAPQTHEAEQPQRTSEEKMLSGLSHLGYFIGLAGLIACVVIYFIYREKSQFVSAHAKQAAGLQAIKLILSLAVKNFMAETVGLGLLTALGTGSGAALGGALGLPLVVAAIYATMMVLAVIAAVKGFRGNEYRYPFIGNFVAGLGE